MRVGIFVDTTNLYHTVYRKYRGKLCYEEYYNRIMENDDPIEEDNKIIQAIAYGMTVGSNDGFINCLDVAGFEVKFRVPKIIKIHDIKIKKCDWNVCMTIDIIRSIEDYDCIIIGSSDPCLLPLINWIKDQGKGIRVVASLIPRVLKEAANCIEIPEEWLEEEENENN